MQGYILCRSLQLAGMQFVLFFWPDKQTTMTTPLVSMPHHAMHAQSQRLREELCRDASHQSFQTLSQCGAQGAKHNDKVCSTIKPRLAPKHAAKPKDPSVLSA